MPFCALPTDRRSSLVRKGRMRRAFREEDILSRACLMKNCEKGVKIFRIETWPSLNAIAGVNDRTATGVCGRDEDLGSLGRMVFRIRTGSAFVMSWGVVDSVGEELVFYVAPFQ